MKLTFTFLISLLLSGLSLTAQTYLMDGSPITDCSGFFLDSGGGTANYGPDENFTTVICSDGSSGTHVRLTFSGVDLAAGDELCFYDGTTAAAPLIACNTDFLPGTPFIIQATAVNPSGCVTLTFVSNSFDESQGWSAGISCIPSCQLIQSELIVSDPVVNPVDTGWIDICPGDIVSFEGAGLYPQNGAVYNHSDLTSSFEWDFGDGTFGLGNNVTHQYDEPGGYIVQLTITDQFGCTNSNFISQRIRVAPPASFTIGDNLVDQICLGDTIELDAVVDTVLLSETVSAVPVEGSFASSGVRSDSLALPDGNGLYQTSVSFTEFAPGQILSNINDLLSICVVIEHSYMRDLEIQLSCPDGTSITLHNFAGQNGGEVFLGEPFENDEGVTPVPGFGYEYCWTPDATAGTWIQFANANNPETLPPGDYNSFDPLTDLLGCPLNGEWTITVQDLWGIDNGFIFEWSINFNPALYPSLETFTAEFIDYQWIQNPSMFYYTQDSVASSPLNAGVGSYIFQVEDAFGCISDTTVTVDILPETHPDCYDCQELLSPVPDTSVCSSESVLLDVAAGDQDTTNVTFEAFPNEEIGFLFYPPGNPFEATLDINSISPGILSNPLQQIQSVCFDLNTNFLGDIDVFLQAPDGSLLELTTDNGANTDFYTNTCFTPDATTPIQSGTTPYTGNFQPEGNWNSLAFAPINGTWTLLVADDSGPASFGTLNNWSITFQSINNIIYNWTPGGTLTCSNCGNPTATPTQSTWYEVNATDSYNCAASDSILVEVLTPVAAPVVDCDSPVPGQIIFTWQQVDTFTLYEVNVNGNGWVPANGTFMHTLTGLANGTVISLEVRVFDDGTICASESATASCITCNAVAVLDGTTDATCNGVCDGTMEVFGASGTAPYNYTIFHEDGLYTFTQASGLFTNLCPGLNIVVVEDFVGCVDTVSAMINEPDAILLEVSQTQLISCSGGNNGAAMVEASGGVGGFTYLWSDPLMQIFPFATQLSAGPVTVVVTDSNNCQQTAVIDIQEPDPISISFIPENILCFQEATGSATAVVTGGTYPYDYQWDDPLYTQDSIVEDLTASTYTLEVLDANNCFANAQVTLTQPGSSVTGSAVQTFVSCYDVDNSQAVVTASGGTGPNYQYLWENGQMTPQASDLPPGPTNVTITDENGCTFVETIDIQEYDSLDILVIFTPVTCYEGEDGVLAVTNVDGGTGSGILTYSWSINPTFNSDIITGLSGDLTYTVTVTDDQGCSNDASTFLPQPPPITLQMDSTDVLCFGGSDGTATVVDVDEAVGPITYSWIPTGQTGNQATGLPAGFYTVQLEDDRGCTAEATVQISQPDPIDIDFEVVSNICFSDAFGSVAALPSGGVGGFSYDWSNGGVTDLITGLTAGNYVVTITDANACEAFDTATVLQPDPINPLVTEVDVSCHGDRNGRIELEPTGGTPPYLYSIDGENFGGSSTLIGLEAGEYTVYIQDANDCMWIEEALIGEPEPIELTFPNGNELIIQLGDSITLDANVLNAIGSYEFFWEAPYEGTLSCNACSNPISNSQNTIMYEVFVVDELGCETSAFLTVRVLKERKVLVPTGFTPNSDGVNDVLLVLGQDGTIIERFQVFDRWGELVHESVNFDINDPVFGWDGRFKGKEMDGGVYIWFLEVRYIDEDREQFKGTSTLIR